MTYYSENAQRIRIWTALIALLLLKWLHHLSRAKWSLSNLASLLRLNLFISRDLVKWPSDPLNTPRLPRATEQLTHALAWVGQAATLQNKDHHPDNAQRPRFSIVSFN